MRNLWLGRVAVVIAAVLMTASLAPRSGAAADAVETVLHSFGSQSGDGNGPGANALIMDAAGTLYGTTTAGGAHGAGTVFELTPNAAKTQWTETVLYSFGARSGDGQNPQGGVIMDALGELYGTTYAGGAQNSACVGGSCGVVFQLTPNLSRTAWTETVLYTFCSQSNCTDGRNPAAGLIMDASGELYGTTYYGGAHVGGTVFALTPNAAKTKWTQTVLYSFCAEYVAGICTDGMFPQAGVVMDAAGTLYGTTGGGGAYAPPGTDGGTVFALTPNATMTTWTHTTLHSFCAQSGCADGESPQSGLIMDATGKLYGMTVQGGANCEDCGTVYELTPNAAKTNWTETVLYSFCGQSGCADGWRGTATLIMDAAGNLYGTTVVGGAYGGPSGAGGGTVFTLTPNAAKTQWAETVLYSFCAQGSCADGYYPGAGLIMDAVGNLYGTTPDGGADSAGAVFSVANVARLPLETPYSFCAQGSPCTDGVGPYDLGRLIMDTSGNLYGTTIYGGAHGVGTVFELTPNAAGTQWTETVLYSFCAQGGTNCTDGAYPEAGVIMDASGKLYGTTIYGGAHVEPNGHTAGTVFELTPNAAKTTWTETVLYSFCAQTGSHGCEDGAYPVAGLIMDAAGKLYGTTTSGGASSADFDGTGTVFALTPNAAKTQWTEMVVYSFCTQGGLDCTDGNYPVAGLIMDAAGKLYGTTETGGANHAGAVFELTPNAAKTTWTETVLYGFCVQGGTDCTDGRKPSAGVIMDTSGQLYGTTDYGGAHGGGTVFALTRNAAKTEWTETVLYSFCAQTDSDGGCEDGNHPVAGLIMDAAGTLYGTTESGGAPHYGGTVFALTPNAAETTWTHEILYGFCALGPPCADGAGPYAGLTMDAAGNLYGTTFYDGAHRPFSSGHYGGTVFELP